LGGFLPPRPSLQGGEGRNFGLFVLRFLRPGPRRKSSGVTPRRAQARSTIASASSRYRWQSGLSAFLDSVRHEARLNAVGIRMARQAAIGRLAAGAHIAGRLRDQPVADVLIAPPIVIIGGWRTGTTILYRLLGGCAGDGNRSAQLGFTSMMRLPGLFAGYNRRHPRDAGGRHRYTPEQFGIDPEVVRSRFSFLDGGH
jgi:hypothetical protein